MAIATKSLRQITDDYYKIKQEADAYWNECISFRVAKCLTKHELVVLMGEVTDACSDGMRELRDMPPGYSERFMLALERLPE